MLAQSASWRMQQQTYGEAAASQQWQEQPVAAPRQQQQQQQVSDFKNTEPRAHIEVTEADNIKILNCPRAPGGGQLDNNDDNNDAGFRGVRGGGILHGATPFLDFFWTRSYGALQHTQ